MGADPESLGRSPGVVQPDTTRCPLCGKPNACRQAAEVPCKGPCWCEQEAFPAEVLERVSKESYGRSCICRDCLVAARRALPPLRPGPGDFYLEPGTGRVVFTEQYHRRRGYCCGSGCRHCPWTQPLPVAGIQSRTLASVGLAAWVAVGILAGLPPASAATWTEDFSTGPIGTRWQVHGTAGLFSWNAEAGRLEVTWDTRGPHSFLSRPLVHPLSASDDFSVSFDLVLSDAAGGMRTGRPGAMQVAVGFLNLGRATSSNYRRGSGKAFETLEFNWFPEGVIPGFGTVEPTLSPIVFDDTGQVRAGFEFPFTWSFHDVYRIELAHQSSPRQAVLRLRNGDGPWVTVSAPLEDLGTFQLDAVAIMVWDERTSFSDSLTAHGTLDNLTVVYPDPPIGAIRQTNPAGNEVEFQSQKGWVYFLEATGVLGSWNTLAPGTPGTGGLLRLADTREAAFPVQYYRVRAERE